MEENKHQVAHRTCKNCSTPVSGYTYCPACGQKSDTHVLSFREFMEELADGLLNMDSRVWRSLLPLALKPGKLTIKYLRGRRMYYLPPFRLYLILSLVFFLIPGNNGNTGDNFGENFIEDDFNVVYRPVDQNVDGEDKGELAEQLRQEVSEELAVARTNNTDTYSIRGGQCLLNGSSPGSLFTSMLRDACLKFTNDPQRFSQDVIDMVPVMMIVGIPLVAFFMFLVYAMSGRYYLEHIIFLLHTHAFFFLASILMALSSALGQRYGFLTETMNWFRIITAWYIPLYIFLAMLSVYNDSKVKTFFKGVFVLIGYGTSILVVAVFGILYSALNI